MNVISADKWYVIQTRSRFEKKCFEMLLLQGINVFYPTKKQQRQWSDRVKEIDAPMFPGYLFVKFEEKERYNILNINGVVRFLSFGGEYASVSERQIEAIGKLEKTDNQIEVIDLELFEGQDVLISSGLFKGHEGKIVHHNGKGKILLAIQSIGKGVLLEIGRTKIEQKHQLSGIN